MPVTTRSSATTRRTTSTATPATTPCPGSGRDILYGGDGTDVVSYTYVDTYYAEAVSPADVSIDLSTGRGRVHATGPFPLDSDQLSQFENVIGSAGNDYITGDAGPNVIWAGGGLNQVFAGAGNDVIHGGPGRGLHLEGGEGDDVIHGGPGRDLLWGSEGDDILFGGTGRDELWGDAGDDFLWSEPAGSYSGKETLLGGPNTTALPGDTCYVPPPVDDHVLYNDCETWATEPA
ncbi:Ca2+-binding RTX toxin-like protein [Actinoplanes couchii]|uniref:Hemolysin-type calcium-binding region n=1 Tax=Actinoplanes couchii TaxID=403638 RepID=A0ABQ3XI64_9ACTN|nr:calcium-binding protein [Actinoplanes couchii]MDR6324649.1 Ca2+-binding RTX toxin-like protein [Actinoplanes couchii]GID58202.1 hypothetical protein Aco03nite_066060 [Actinoplanes couchii]